MTCPQCQGHGSVCTHYKCYNYEGCKHTSCEKNEFCRLCNGTGQLVFEFPIGIEAM